jgi:type IV pilus assembly protein PilE
MKIENCKLKISNKAFTLIEIMVAIAIVGIMAAVVLVSMKSYAVKARASKGAAVLSSVIPSMYSCWGNGGIVNDTSVSGGGDICSLNPSYGKWPTPLAEGGYELGSSAKGGDFDGSFTFNKNQWWVGFGSLGGDDMKICCNSATNSCFSYGGDDKDCCCWSNLTEDLKKCVYSCGLPG